MNVGGAADGSKSETVKFEKTTDDIIRKMHGNILHSLLQKHCMGP